MVNSSTDKNEGTYRIVGRGEEGPLCDPGSELLRLGEGARAEQE